MNRSDAGKKGFKKTGHILREKWEEKSRLTRKTYENDPKLCPTCGEVIPYEKRDNKFCNSSCSATYNNQGVVRVETVNDENCAFCGRPKEKRHNKYCDICIEANVYSNRITDLEAATIDRTRKRLLIEMRGHRCEVCEYTTWTGLPIPLELHHIDGNADNSDEANLKLICPNCHALTENYKGANIGIDSSRQKKRRRRYKEGKTY